MSKEVSPKGALTRRAFDKGLTLHRPAAHAATAVMKQDGARLEQLCVPGHGSLLVMRSCSK